MKKLCSLAPILAMLAMYIHLFAQQDKDVIVDTNIVKPTLVMIDPLSIHPLYLIQVKGDDPLGTATGFIVAKGEKKYLVTNWHVVTGRHPHSNQPICPQGKTPDALLIWHHGKTLGTWVRKREALLDKNGIRRWLEHKSGKAVDLVALPLAEISQDVQVYPFDLSLANTDMLPEVAMPVSIIGFPVGPYKCGLLPDLEDRPYRVRTQSRLSQ